jgi:Protein of unknown function (DUF3352)
MRKLILILAVLSAAVVGALGCGSEDQAASGAAELVPAGAAMYAEATLRPEGEQKKAIEAILAKFPGGGEAGEKLKDLIEKGLRESEAPVSFREDIEPWLGDEAAFFARDLSPNGDFKTVAGLVATEDEDKALAALEKSAEGEISRKSHNDVEYLMDESDEAAAVLDGYLVLGSEAGVKAVIDTSKDGSPLSEDEDFTSVTDKAADDRLGLFYLNSPEFLKTLRQQGAPVPDSVGKFFEEPAIATLDADEDGVTLEGTVPEGLGRASLFGQGSDLLTELPADSWVAVAQTDFGKLLEFYVDFLAGIAGGRDAVEQQFKAATGLDLQEDVLDWMGDYGIFVRGTRVAALEGALIIETKDEEASGRALAALERVSKDQADGAGTEVGPLSAAGGGEGFTVRGGGIPKPIHAFQRDGRVVFAYGDTAAKDAIDPGEKLGDSADFTGARDSLGDDVDVSAYVLMQPIFDLIDSTEAASDADWQKAKPYLEPLSAIVSGSSGGGDDLRYAFKLIVE